jgi:hypothetical protein
MKHDRVSVLGPFAAVFSAWMIVLPGAASGAECAGKSVATCADLLAQKVDDLTNENHQLRVHISNIEEAIRSLQKNALRIESGAAITLVPGNTGRVTFKKPFDEVPAVYTGVEQYEGGNIVTSGGSYLRFGFSCEADKLGISYHDREDATPPHHMTISWLAIGY